MTTGRVNLKVVGDLLQGVEDCLTGLRSLPAGSQEEFTADFRNPAAAESFLRRAIQGLFDILRHLLAKGYGQGALEYKELARLAAEKDLIRDPALAEVLRKLGGFRNRLTHFYQEVTAGELYGILRGELGDVEGIAAELRAAAIRVSQA
ncbi:MAG TPA: DUF86 domain-containing protein [Thermoanaerobaculia bacterium]|jgi:uncharacterized protein YutE (UPF0331/DUF86 family)|nr:DUF86 domain-containing protein [Thermoanaerobaculia bacterium]